MTTTFATLVEGADNYLVRQLLSMKRCFGGHASLGIVMSAGETRQYRTIQELVADGHVPMDFEWMDRFLPQIPSVSEMSCDDDRLVLTETDYWWDGPECPWVTARKEQKAAAERAKARRQSRMNKRIVTTSCACSLKPVSEVNRDVHAYQIISGGEQIGVASYAPNIKQWVVEFDPNVAVTQEYVSCVFARLMSAVMNQPHMCSCGLRVDPSKE